MGVTVATRAWRACCIKFAEADPLRVDMDYDSEGSPIQNSSLYIPLCRSYASVTKVFML